MEFLIIKPIVEPCPILGIVELIRFVQSLMSSPSLALPNYLDNSKVYIFRVLIILSRIIEW